MPALTPKEFLDYLKRSDLLDVAEYENALETIRQETPRAFDDADLLASEFVKRNLLTSWHVRQLMKRKYKGFYLRQYRILGHLGSGGMSSVYLGEHTVMKRRVAIKVLPKKKLNPTYLDRFAREAQAIANLDSEHVVRAYDVDRFEDVHYIVMEYFEGQNLRQLVDKEGPLDYEDAANYIRQAALGLADAHKRGIVHRDVKPENIVVDDHNLVKLLDLGLALLDEGAFAIQGSMADEDKILGTADYLAPEQALDSHNVDARADIYGLGATLYFCLTGKPPFPFGTISERLLAHQKKEPASVFNERPDAPVDLVEICKKMMEKKPENRIQSAAQVAEIMKQWLIRNGFAQPNDFAFDKNTTVGAEDFNDLVQSSEEEQRFLLNNEKATEIGFDKPSTTFRMSDAELADVVQKRSADAVDLYDATESAGSISKSKLARSSVNARRSTLSASDNIVLSQKSGVGSQTTLDPLELALDEIAADAPKMASTLEANDDANLEAANLSRSDSSARSNGDPRVPNSKATANANIQQDAMESATIRSDGDAVEVNSKTNANDWYKHVPIWFWTIVIGGYAVAMFLAGALFMVILNLNK